MSDLDGHLAEANETIAALDADIALLGRNVTALGDDLSAAEEVSRGLASALDRAEENIEALSNTTVGNLTVDMVSVKESIRKLESADDGLAQGYADADAVVTNAFGEADANVTAAFEDADKAIRTDFEDADDSIRADFANADAVVRKDFAAADAVVTTAFKDADKAIRTDFEAADANVTTAFEEADANVTAAFGNADLLLSASISSVADDLSALSTRFSPVETDVADIIAGGSGVMGRTCIEYTMRYIIVRGGLVMCECGYRPNSVTYADVYAEDAYEWTGITCNTQSKRLASIPRPALPGMANAVVMDLSDGRSVYTGIDASTGKFTFAELKKDMTAHLFKAFEDVLAGVTPTFQFSSEPALRYSSPVVDGTSVWLVGPYALYRYDVDSPGTLTEVQDLPAHTSPSTLAAPHNRERRTPAVAVSGSKLFVAGGSAGNVVAIQTGGNKQNPVFTDFWNQGSQLVKSVVYCVLDGSGGCGAWSTLTDTLGGDGRAFMSYCARGSLLYLVGGRSSSWDYRVALDGTVNDGDVATVGGQVATVEVIDMSDGGGIDTSFGSLPVALEWGDYDSGNLATLGTIGTGSRSQCSFSSDGSTLYVGGGGSGSTGSGVASEKVYALDVATKVFTEVAGVTLPGAQFGFKTTLHTNSDGKVLIYSADATVAAMSLDVAVAA